MGFEDDIKNATNYLTKKQANYDRVVTLSRDVIREAGQIITMLHNDRIAGANSLIKSIKNRIKSMNKIDTNFKYYTSQAYQEYAEAMLLYGIKTKKRITSMKELGVEPEAYLSGMLDAVGELRRSMLEALMKDMHSEAKLYFSFMKKVYDATRGIRFTDAILSGFRRKQDVARMQIENASSELLHFKRR